MTKKQVAKFMGFDLPSELEIVGLKTLAFKLDKKDSDDYFELVMFEDWLSNKNIILKVTDTDWEKTFLIVKGNQTINIRQLSSSHISPIMKNLSSVYKQQNDLVEEILNTFN